MESKSQSRLALFLIFFFHGGIFGNWVTRIPEVKNRLDLSEAGLGLLLLGISTGLIVTISFTGGIIKRFGSKAVTFASTILASSILLLMAWAPTFATMWVVLFLFGSAMTFMDIAMNAQAVEIERRYNQPIMSSFHGAYSIGGFAGAAYGGILLDLQLDVMIHFLSVAVLIYIFSIYLVRYFVADLEVVDEEDTPVFKLPPKALLPLGIIAFLSSIGEGTMADWTGIFLIQTLNVTESRAAWGFAVFSLTMTTGRFTGDKLTELFSRVSILRGSGLLSSIGLITSILSENFWITLVGFGCVGLGLSVVIPIAFSAAGNMPGYASGVGIASVASIGYLGFLSGPPLIGFVAEFSSLVISFTIVAISLIGIFLLAGQVEKSQISKE